MPRRTKSIPKYALHKASGQAIVRLDGHVCYLGPHGSAASRQEYDRLVAEWLANGRRSAATIDSGITVAEVLAAFWEHAQKHYRHPDGSPTSEVDNCRQAMRPVYALYEEVPAVQFGPRALKTVRQAMIDHGLVRTSINRHIDRIKHFFEWAASEELIPVDVAQALRTVPGLQKNRCDAREAAPRQPVPLEVVRETLPHMERHCRAMGLVQLSTGMRAGEVCAMRIGDIDRRPDPVHGCWHYRPDRHKTAHHGHQLEVVLGPTEQELLRPFLDAPPGWAVFRPAEADEERRQERTKRRRTPLTCSNRRGTNRVQARWDEGEPYTVNGYRQAIERACEAAFPPPGELARRPKESIVSYRKRLAAPDGEHWQQLLEWGRRHRWTPHQLRHRAAHEIQERFGIEGARARLNHRTFNMTTHYAGKNRTLARTVAEMLAPELVSAVVADKPVFHSPPAQPV